MLIFCLRFACCFSFLALFFVAMAADSSICSSEVSVVAGKEAVVQREHHVDYQGMLELSKAALVGKDIKCIVCYAWNEDHTHPYNQFAQRIANTLSQAGVSMYLDLKNLNVGDNIEDYVKRISDPNYFVILLITPLVAERCQINEHALGVGEQVPWIKKEVMRIAERLLLDNFFYIPILLGNTREDIESHEVITRIFNDYMRVRNPSHTDKNFLYKDFSDEARYYDNVLEIITRKFATVQNGRSGLPNPVIIRKDDNYYNTLSIYDHLSIFFFDYVEPNALPIVALFISGYFGIRHFNNNGV